MTYVKASEIREILKITEQPEVISFAGGLPAPELFPVQQLTEVCCRVLSGNGMKALQYASTEGFKPLRSWIARRMNSRLGTSFTEDSVLITHGSQQALDLSGKVFLDEGDVVLCESPTYLAALSAFRAYGCRFIDVPTDSGGMDMRALEHILETTPGVKLIYIIPDFQNPTGRTWDLERRKTLAELSARFGVAVVEDNPYGELRFEGDFLPAAASFDTEGTILCTGTFSKILCPGYRIGWIAGDPGIIRQYVLVKQGTDLQCNTLAQMEIAAYLETYDIDAHIGAIRELYRARRDVMLQSMKREFPDCVSVTKPQGGLFAWVTLPEYLDARLLLEKCLAENVAFVPGSPFFPNGGHANTFRVNYSNMPEERIKEGVERMGRILRTCVR